MGAVAKLEDAGDVVTDPVDCRFESYLLPQLVNRRASCEFSWCTNRAIPRKLFVDSEGFWTDLCQDHLNRVIGWHE